MAQAPRSAPQAPTLIASAAMGGPATIDGQEVAHTDNFFEATFVLDGVQWPTCEHFYQAAKFAEDERAQARSAVEEIRSAPSPHRAWSRAQRHGELLREDWEYVKVNVMYRAVAAKYSQYPEYAKELAATTGGIQTAVSTVDWQRMNRLILERVREEARSADQRNEKRLAALVGLTEPRAQGAGVLEKLRQFAGQH
mmetsp:Transcript_64634/g.182256  ORF Transcript_64634/g.182256 Transcript_64634/m.182256 type:complete len:196 (+) Transcript_64634:2-589(+)